MLRWLMSLLILFVCARVAMMLQKDVGSSLWWKKQSRRALIFENLDGRYFQVYFEF